MDDYLLGKDLGGYFDSFEYARLNVPERILLARRHQGRIDGIRMDLRDRISLIPPDLDRETTLFEGALAAFGMSGERGAGMANAKNKAMKEMAAAEPFDSTSIVAKPRRAMRRQLWERAQEDGVEA